MDFNLLPATQDLLETSNDYQGTNSTASRKDGLISQGKNSVASRKDGPNYQGKSSVANIKDGA